MAIELLTLPLAGFRRAPQRWRALGAYRSAQDRLRSAPPAQESVARTQLGVASDGSGLSVQEVEQLVDEWMQERPLKYLRLCRVAGLEPLLDLLDERGVHSGVLSDYPAKAKLQALGLDGRFSPVLCSTDPGLNALKPNPSGFLRASALWNIPPHEVLMVGDRMDVDGAGARAAGMPCAIIGRRATGVQPTPGCITIRSIESLRRTLDNG